MRCIRQIRLVPAHLTVLCCLITPCYLHAQQNDSTPEELVALGDNYLSEGNLRDARAAYTKAVTDQDAPFVPALTGLAKISIENEDWTEAGDWLNKALARDDDNWEAHYYRGIVYRELAKYKTISQAHHWRGAEQDFDWILSRDSLYKDALYQYALTDLYHENYSEAIRLIHRQIVLRPELEEPRQEIFRFYRQFLHLNDTEIVRAYLDAEGGDYADFFKAELLRREGNLDEADALLTRLSGRTLVFPVQPVLLAQARIYYTKNLPARAQQLVQQAIDRITSPLDARLVFDDFKYIANEAEISQFQALKDPEAYKLFFTGFWDKRDPLPASRVNARMQEHYRRLLKAEKDYVFYGFRLWHNDPDRLGELDFPAAYKLNREFNDKGLIYIRHGEPDDREMYAGSDADVGTQRMDSDLFWIPYEHSYESGWVPNESWRYNNPRMDLHFVIDEGASGNNWRLTPRLTNFGMLENLEHWGRPYDQIVAAIRRLQDVQGSKGQSLLPDPVRASDNPILDNTVDVDSLRDLQTTEMNRTFLSDYNPGLLEFTELQNKLADQSREAIELGLTTDRHTWEKEVLEMQMPYVLSAFRGEDGKTRLEFTFAIPIGKISREVDPKAGTVNFELGYAIHDTAWATVAEASEVKALPAAPDITAAGIDFFSVSVPADSYHVSLFGRPTAKEYVGGHRIDFRVPDYSRPGFAMSDLLLASEIRPVSLPSRFDRGDLHVSPNPFNRFSTVQPVFVYFEIYDLTLSANDQTDFTVEYTLIPEEKRSVRGIFGRKDQVALSLIVERSSLETSPVEYAEIDVKDVEPGKYTLLVRVTDRNTGSTQEKTRPLELYFYE